MIQIFIMKIPFYVFCVGHIWPLFLLKIHTTKYQCGIYVCDLFLNF
jgi:hypothetical protein